MPTVKPRVTWEHAVEQMGAAASALGRQPRHSGLLLLLLFKGAGYTHCLHVVTSFRYFVSLPCMPATNPSAKRDVRVGSSPGVSIPRPHLQGSVRASGCCQIVKLCQGLRAVSLAGPQAAG